MISEAAGIWQRGFVLHSHTSCVTLGSGECLWGLRHCWRRDWARRVTFPCKKGEEQLPDDLEVNFLCHPLNPSGPEPSTIPSRIFTGT